MGCYFKILAPVEVLSMICLGTAQGSVQGMLSNPCSLHLAVCYVGSTSLGWYHFST